MKFKKLVTASLADALKGMKVGETCIAPDGSAPATVTKACSDLKREGYAFTTSRKTGSQTVTRLK